MRNGKSIWIVLSGLLVGAFLAPTWQWYLGRLLDSATHGQTGIHGAIVRGMHMISPLQQVLFGAAAGMLLTLLIGYAHVWIIWGRRVWYVLVYVPRFLVMARPGVHALGHLEVSFPIDTAEMMIVLPKAIDVVNVGLDRKQFYLKRNSEDGLLITRASSGFEAERPQTFGCNIWGRWRLWPLLRFWVTLDLARYPIGREEIETAFNRLLWQIDINRPAENL